MPTDFKKAFARLTAEYVDLTKDRLDEIDVAIEAIYSEQGNRGELYYELCRNLHSVKGSAGSYGFHFISMIAHRAEDYMESVTRLEGPHWLDVQKFIDQMRSVLDAGEDPSVEFQQQILNGLPTSAQKDVSEQDTRQVTVVVVMPSGVQRTLVSNELTSCGFDVSYADHPIRALELALAIKPDAILSNLELPAVSGIELAQMLNVTSAGVDIPFALMTSHENLEAVRARLPADVGLISKNQTFIENLTAYLVEIGLFGGLNGDAKLSA